MIVVKSNGNELVKMMKLFLNSVRDILTVDSDAISRTTKYQHSTYVGRQRLWFGK